MHENGYCIALGRRFSTSIPRDPELGWVYHTVQLCRGNVLRAKRMYHTARQRMYCAVLLGAVGVSDCICVIAI